MEVRSEFFGIMRVEQAEVLRRLDGGLNLCKLLCFAHLAIGIGLGGLRGRSYVGDMKRVALGAVLMFVAGCSNAPVAGFLDSCFPSKPSGPLSDRPRNPLPPGDRLPPPAELGGPVGPPMAGN